MTRTFLLALAFVMAGCSMPRLDPANSYLESTRQALDAIDKLEHALDVTSKQRDDFFKQIQGNVKQIQDDGRVMQKELVEIKRLRKQVEDLQSERASLLRPEIIPSVTLGEPATDHCAETPNGLGIICQ